MQHTFFILFFIFLSLSRSLAAITEINFSSLQIPAVLIGDPGNQGDLGIGGRGLGMVATPFYLGKYEITAAEFSPFLNAVASTSDAHGLYQPGMSLDTNVACITYTLEEGAYHYAPISGRENIPVTYVSLHTAERYCNWLANGSPSAANGDEEAILEASTETGPYTFSQQGNQEISTFHPEATNTEGLLYYIPSETEWVKAGYYKGNGTNSGYWAYPTQHDVAPANGQGDPSNQANYRTLATGWKTRFSNPVLTEVDHFEETFSFYGCRDMGGNVAEWTTSLGEWSSYHDNSSNAIVRGGSWQSQYSIFYDNDLMRTAPSKCYAPLTATNTIGFRIAVAIPTASLAENGAEDSGCMEMPDFSGDASLLLWPLIRQATIGCPRAMAQALLAYLFNIGENAFAIGGAIIGVDLLAFLGISVALEAAYTLTMHPSSKGIREALPEAIGNALKSTLGCGMCQLGLLQTLSKNLGLSTALLDSAKESVERWSAGEGADALGYYLPCVSTETIEFCLIRMAPVIPELAIAGGLLVALRYFLPTICSNACDSYSTIQDAACDSYAAIHDGVLQSLYALKNFF